jgi:hypothetical protein
MNHVFPKCRRTQDRCGHSHHFPLYHYETALTELKQPIASFSSQRPRFTPWAFRVVLVTDKKEALVRIFLCYCGFMPFTISPLLLGHSSIIFGVVNGDVRDCSYNAPRDQLRINLQNRHIAKCINNIEEYKQYKQYNKITRYININNITRI